MSFKEIDAQKDLSINPFEMISKGWFLVSAGNKDNYNTMTASWGFMGVIWGKDVITTVIRPQRYTKEFVENNDTFTISFFDDEYKKALSFCGANSGRDYDKAKETGLTPEFIDDTVTFKEAKLVFICKKLYSQNIFPELFIDESIPNKWYPEKDFHTAYVGEILKTYIKE